MYVIPLLRPSPQSLVAAEHTRVPFGHFLRRRRCSRLLYSDKPTPNAWVVLSPGRLLFTRAHAYGMGYEVNPCSGKHERCCFFRAIGVHP